MITNPLSNDLVVLKNIDAVKQAVLRLVLTNHYEIPFEPFKGANISALLFEPADQFTAFTMKERIIDTLARYEPRIGTVKVEIIDNVDRNAYQVSITFTIIAYQQSIDIEFNLQRLR
tara:strand:- start:2995 stop:3345 length:351 start_codon:yes stop_codon:yes gene_type:complete